MIRIDDVVLTIYLTKHNNRWHLQTNDRTWRYLDKNGYKTDNVVINYFLDNLRNCYGLQGTSTMTLPIDNELLANWIREGII